LSNSVEILPDLSERRIKSGPPQFLPTVLIDRKPAA
jgi:hypothetical protein